MMELKLTATIVLPTIAYVLYEYLHEQEKKGELKWWK